jgi:hypothetical protein
VSYIEELRDVIRKLHGVESKHLESVPIEETFQGQTVWEGVVEIFQLIGHPKAFQVFAWSHETDAKEKRHVTVLQIHPIVSARDAVRAAIVQESKGLGTEES